MNFFINENFISVIRFPFPTAAIHKIISRNNHTEYGLPTTTNILHVQKNKSNGLKKSFLVNWGILPGIETCGQAKLTRNETNVIADNFISDQSTPTRSEVECRSRTDRQLLKLHAINLYFRPQSKEKKFSYLLEAFI